MRIKIIHKRVPETASDCVSCVSVGLLWRSSTNFFVSVVVCWLFIRNRTAENILKWKVKDRRAIVISQGLSSKLGNLAEVRYLGNLLYLDCPSHVDRQSPMGGNCRQQLYFYFFFNVLNDLEDRQLGMIDYSGYSSLYSWRQWDIAWKFRADGSQLSFELFFQWKNYF